MMKLCLPLKSFLFISLYDMIHMCCCLFSFGLFLFITQWILISNHYVLMPRIPKWIGSSMSPVSFLLKRPWANKGKIIKLIHVCIQTAYDEMMTRQTIKYILLGFLVICMWKFGLWLHIMQKSISSRRQTLNTKSRILWFRDREESFKT